MNDNFAQKRADFFKALSHPTRVRILELLRKDELCVCHIFEALDLEQSNVSQHLAILRKQGILTARKKGIMVIYQVKNKAVLDLLDVVTAIIMEGVREETKILEGIKPG